MSSTAVLQDPMDQVRALKSIDLHSFTKSWVAGLVTNHVDRIRPHDPFMREAFKAVLEALDRRVDRLSEQKVPSEAILPLLQVANELRPSNTGAFEGFETALRSLQLTFTSSPNPWYDNIEFPVSQIQAESFLSSIPDVQREIALEAASAFAASINRRNQSSNVSEKAAEAQGCVARE
jgi:hypothetical protein